MPDIDIDFADRDVILSQLEHRVAKLNTGKKHNGYLHKLPYDELKRAKHYIITNYKAQLFKR